MDDSIDKGTRDLVDDKVAEWRERGVEVEVRRRTNRAGYKAGALHEVRTPPLPSRPLRAPPCGKENRAGTLTNNCSFRGALPCSFVCRYIS